MEQGDIGEPQGLSFEELEQKANDLHEQFKSIYPIEREERTLVEKDLPEYIPFITLSKSSLNPEEKYPTHYRPNDAIEIKIEKGRDQNLIWSIRNKSLSDQEAKAVPKGEIKAGTADDVAKFIEEVDPERIGTHHLTPILKDMADNKEGRKKPYLFVTPESKIAGIAFVSEVPNSCYLSTLATNPDFENQGIASALLAELKRRYESITVSPMPFDMTNPDRGAASDRLRRFYKQNGFVGGNEWSRHTISLDDISTAGNWQTIDENTVWNLGVDQHKVSTIDIKRCVLRFIISNDSLIKKFPEEDRGNLYKWDASSKKMHKIEEEQEETNKALTSSSSREYWRKQYPPIT